MEQSFIAWAKQRASKLPKVTLGIGDDAAILDHLSAGAVVTTDSLCEGTHFRLAECGPRLVGRKLAGVNLSDLAAMAADPVALFLSVCLPRTNASKIATEVFEGVFELASQYQVAIAGGDTNVWDGPLVVHMTAIGSSPPKGAWTRAGAKVGDAIIVTGSLGGSLRGKHLHFDPRVSLAQKLRDSTTVHAATDISDGLGIDLLSICAPSGCGARLDLDRIPISHDARELSNESGLPALDHALGDGEDFELLLAIPAEEAARLPPEIDGIPLTKIGEFASRTGLWTKSGANWKQVPPRGYVHR